MVTASASMESAVDALRAGAYDFIAKPVRNEELLNRLSQIRAMRGLADENRTLRQAVRALSALPRVGDGAMHRMLLFGGGHLIVPVDRDVTRLGVRLTAVESSVPGTPRRVRRALERGLPRDSGVYLRAALYVKHHAVQTCTDDPHCAVCPLSDTCAGKRC